MADISVLDFGDGGGNRNIKDATARTNVTNAQNMLAYREDGNTASQAYAIVGTPINWKGTLYYLKTAVAAGTAWAVGTNLTAATNLGKLTRNIKVYVGGDSKIHFTDLTGADTALNFSGGGLDLLDSTRFAINAGTTKTVAGSSKYKYLLLQMQFSTTDHSVQLFVIPQSGTVSTHVAYDDTIYYSYVQAYRSGNNIISPQTADYIYCTKIFGANDDKYYLV